MFMKVSVSQHERFPTLNRLSMSKFFAVAFSVVAIMFFSFAAGAQNTIRVSGHVTNEAGQPVPKVSVTIKGTSQGVTGDDNGNRAGRPTCRVRRLC